VIIYSWNCKVT